MEHLGRVFISQQLVMEWLQYAGGKIRACEIDPYALTLMLTIEHPDMPEVIEGESIPVATPVYTKHYDNVERIKG